MVFSKIALNWDISQILLCSFAFDDSSAPWGWFHRPQLGGNVPREGLVVTGRSSTSSSSSLSSSSSSVWRRCCCSCSCCSCCAAGWCEFGIKQKPGVQNLKAILRGWVKTEDYSQAAPIQEAFNWSHSCFCGKFHGRPVGIGREWRTLVEGLHQSASTTTTTDCRKKEKKGGKKDYKIRDLSWRPWG